MEFDRFIRVVKSNDATQDLRELAGSNAGWLYNKYLDMMNQASVSREVSIASNETGADSIIKFRSLEQHLNDRLSMLNLVEAVGGGI